MTSIAMSAAIMESDNARKIAKSALDKLETKNELWHEAVASLNVANKEIRHREEQLANIEPDYYCGCTNVDPLLSELDAIGWRAYHNVDRANIMVFVAQNEFEEAKSKAILATAVVRSLIAIETEAKSGYDRY